MREQTSRRAWLAIGAGVILGMGGSVVAGQLTGQAAAQTSGSPAAAGIQLTTGQLLINQRISQAAVRRSNEGLNLLDPIRPNAKQPAKVLGWRSTDLRDGAVTTAKLLDRAVTTPKIADNAITPAQLNEGLREGQPRWARVAETGALNGTSGVTAVTRSANGAYTVKFDRNISTCAVQATVSGVGTTAPPVGHTIATWTSPGDPTVVQVATADGDGAASDTPFHVSALC